MTGDDRTELRAKIAADFAPLHEAIAMLFPPCRDCAATNATGSDGRCDRCQDKHEQAMLDEHPNGTRDVVPVFGEA